jgi:hypothetical protein
MRPGATWTFSTPNGDQTWTVTEVTGNQSNAEATMSFSMAEFSGSYHWKCTTEGIVSYDFSSLSSGVGVTANMEVTDQSGIWLPRADQLVPGATWRNDYSLHFTSSDSGETITVDERFAQAFTAVGIQQMSVAGAQVDAWQVDSASTVTINSAGQSNSFSSTGAIYYGRGVGPVRIDSSGGGASSSSILQSYSIP